MRYVVLLHGRGMLIPTVYGDSTIRGFFTHRVLDAATPEAAFERARQMIERELRKRFTVEQTATALIELESIQQVSWWHRRFRPGAGFTFYSSDQE